MDFLYPLLKLIHVFSMAIWIGAPLLLGRDIRSSISAGETNSLINRIDALNRLTLWSGLITFVTGFVLIFVLGGFKAVHPGIHIGLLLTIVLLGISHGMTYPTWRKLKADEFRSGALLGKLSLANGIEHTLKLVILILMVVKQLWG